MRIHVSDALIGALAIAGGAAVVAQIREMQRLEQRQALFAQAAGQPARRIVVVGVGFAGLAAINRLGELIGDDPRYDVLLLDRQNYHLFTPLLYQVATGGVEPGLLTYPARRVVRRRGFRFLEATVHSVDVEKRRLETDAGPIDFDDLILAPGSVPNYFGMADAEQNSLPLKWLRDGTRVHDQVINCFELADRETSTDRRQALLTFVIVGGGATGVELAASLSDLIFGNLVPYYPTLTAAEVQLILIEARETLLPGWNPRVADMAARRLTHQHVQLRLGTTVAHVDEGGVELRTGERISSATVIWTAGVRAEPLVGTLPGEKERDGRVRVTPTLELPGYPGIFVAGDAAAVTLPGTPRPLPPTAWAAIGEGRTAAENLVRRLRGEEPAVVSIRAPGDLVSLGRGAAAADLHGVVFDSLPAWLIRRGVYLLNLVGFRNRLLVALEWAFVTFHERTIASFVSATEQLRVALAAPARLRPRIGRRAASAASSAEAPGERRAG